MTVSEVRKDSKYKEIAHIDLFWEILSAFENKLLKDSKILQQKTREVFKQLEVN